MLKNRLELADMLREEMEKKADLLENRYYAGAEIGVFNGYFSEHLCKNIPGLKLYAIDPWQVYEGYRDHKFKKSMDTAYLMARERLGRFDVEFIRKFSMDAVKDFKDGSLDFVYIDANHEYKYVKEDIEAWTPKIRIGGTVAGDDYYLTPSGNVGVIKAVDEYVRKNGYILHITDWDMENPVEDNRQPAWYFIKTHQ